MRLTRGRPGFVAVSALLVLSACAGTVDEDVEMDGAPESDESAELEKAQPVADAAGKASAGSLAVLAQVGTVVSGTYSALNLALTLAGKEASLSEQAIAQIAALLDQRRLEDTLWRTRSKTGELGAAENLYVRYECVQSGSACRSSLVRTMADHALNIHQRAANLFYDTTEATVLGDRRLQLVPAMVRGGAALIFAMHEIALTEKLNGARPADLSRRVASMKNTAQEILYALDDMEDLFNDHVRRTKFGPIEYTSSVAYGNATSVLMGSFKSPYPYDDLGADPRGRYVRRLRFKAQNQDHVRRMGAELTRILDVEKEKQVQRYIAEKRNGVFGSNFQAVRTKLKALVGKPSPNIFAWSAAGKVSGMTCTQVREPAKSASYGWNNNYFCASRDLGIRYSDAGPIPGMRCTGLSKPDDRSAWWNNYLCVPTTSPWTFHWAHSAATALDHFYRKGRDCLVWTEPSDPKWKAPGASPGYLCMDRL